MKTIFKKRSVFRVEWNKRDKIWGVLAPGKWGTGVGPLWVAKYKLGAIHEGADIARKIWKNKGQITQLVIHAKDGHICSERTYGRDPRKSKG